MRNDHKLNGWPTPPGRAPGASVAPASCLDDRRKNDAIHDQDHQMIFTWELNHDANRVREHR